MFDFGARVQLHRFKLKVSDVHMDNKFNTTNKHNRSLSQRYLVIAERSTNFNIASS